MGTTGEKGCVTAELLPMTGYQFRMVSGEQSLPTVQQIVPFNTTLVIDFIIPPLKSLEEPVSYDTDITVVNPNPFINHINVEISMDTRGPIEISCYNIMGVKVIELLNEVMPSGNHSLQWNIDLPPGPYFLRVALNGQFLTRKIIRQ